MQRGESWFAATPGGDRPVLVLTHDPVVDRIGAVLVAALARTVRGLVSELELTPADDGVPTRCVAALREAVPAPGADRFLAPDIDAAVQLITGGAIQAAAESVAHPLS